MEESNVDEWTAGGAAALSKQTTNPHTGLRCLRVAGAVLGFAYQPGTVTINRVHHIVGWARGDGTAGPSVNLATGAPLWTGTASTTWQPFDLKALATGASDFLFRWGLGAGGSYVEFDDLYVSLAPLHGLLVDGDMEAVNIDAWTPINNAVLTKETGTPHQGLRVLRVTGDGVTANPSATQYVLTSGRDYRLVGKARSDGASVPRILHVGVEWTGTTSTDWQDVLAEFTATGTPISLNHSLATAYAEWDYLHLIDVT
jgi:hypothetical protein